MEGLAVGALTVEGPAVELPAAEASSVGVSSEEAADLGVPIATGLDLAVLTEERGLLGFEIGRSGKLGPLVEVIPNTGGALPNGEVPT